jgi:hypothetical protein
MGKGVNKELWRIVIAAIILASPRAILAMGSAWELNPGGAMHELGIDGASIIHWRAWLLVGATWFLPVFVSVCALGAFLHAAIRAARRGPV